MNDEKRPELIPEPATDKEYARDSSNSMNLPHTDWSKLDLEKLFAALIRIYDARGLELIITRVSDGKVMGIS